MFGNEYKVCIKSVAVEIPNNQIGNLELISRIRVDQHIVNKTGIEKIYVANHGELTTEITTRAVKKSIVDIEPKSIDEMVYISEGISDYLYMDTSKTILKNIGGRTDNVVYTYDIFAGNCGTIGIIQLIGNQLIYNRNVSTAVVASGLLWENHSQRRTLGATVLGDGAGSIVLQEGLGKNEILSIVRESMSEYNLVAGFKYGGTKYDLPKEALERGGFTYGILNVLHLSGVLEKIVELSEKAGWKAIEISGLSQYEIDCIGIAGFSKKINDDILNHFEIARKIDMFTQGGFLGTVGSIRVLDAFINDGSYKNGDVMLVISNGIDCNVEAMVIRK